MSWDLNGDDALYGTGGSASPMLTGTLYSIGACEENDADCLSCLGMMYDHGYQNNPTEHTRATGFYACAISGGDVSATYNLANTLANGAEGVDADPVRAVELYSRAIDKGSLDGGAGICSFSNLDHLLLRDAEGLDPDPTRAVDLFNWAIAEGDVQARVSLASLLENGAHGVDADPIRAAELYRRAFDEGFHTGAMFDLAVLFENGAPGLDADPARV